MGQIYTVKDDKGNAKYPVTVSDAVFIGGKKLTEAHRQKAEQAEIERLDEECVKSREAGEADLTQGGNTVAVEDNLVSTSKTTALSANQGRVLKELIDSIPQGGGSSGGGGASVPVVDNLLSTSQGSALSANQGRLLKGMVDGKQDKITESNKLSYSLLSGTPTIPDAVTEQTVEGWGFTKGYTKSEIDNMIGNIETLLAAL